MDEPSNVSAPRFIVSYFSRNYWRVQQGLTRISIVLSLIGFFTFAKVWQESFEYWGIPIEAVIFGMAFMFAFISWVIGFYNERWQLSRGEFLHQIQVQNPEYFWMLQMMSKVGKKLDIDGADIPLAQECPVPEKSPRIREMVADKLKQKKKV